MCFSSPKGNGSKNELNLNLQKLLLSVTIKHHSDTNNVISCFSRFSLQPARNYFTTEAPFCFIKHDGTNVITKEITYKKGETRRSLPAERGSGFISGDLVQVRQVWMQPADTAIIVIQQLSLAELICFTSPLCNSDSTNEEEFFGFAWVAIHSRWIIINVESVTVRVGNRRSCFTDITESNSM